MNYVTLRLMPEQRKYPGLIRFVSVFFLTVLLSASLYAQEIVRGKVTDESGTGMPGVNIIIKGTAQGTTTDAQGNYSVEVPADAAQKVLIFSFIGYTTQEVSIEGRTVLNVSLAPSVYALGEVVVVGYGTQRRADVTGSLVTVNSEALREVPVANLQQALQGRAAGVEVQRVGTAPGATARIRVRGERTINGSNDPLLVLDGIPFEGNISDINPDEIESVNVLKDASATAIYGSRGANGVIIITTKRGIVGETRVTLNSYYGITTVARKYDMFNAEEYATMRDISGFTEGYQPEEIEGMALGRNTDWQELMYENGIITNHNIGITGGSENGRYAVSGGYYKETTILPGQDFERYSLKTTLDNNIGNRIRIGLNSLNSISYTNGSQFVNQQPNTPGAFGGGVMYPILALSPLMPAYDENGEIFRTPAGNQTDRTQQYNPLLLKTNNDDWTDRIRRFRSFNSAFGEIEIIDGLKYRFNVGLDFTQANSAQFQGQDTYFRTQNQSNRARVRNEEQISWTAENVVTYDKTFANDHRLTFTGLYSAQQSKTWSTMVSKDSINADFIQYYNMGIASPTANHLLDGGESTWGLISYMARVNYAFKDRYLITLTYRRDGSSRLAQKWHNYPAVAVGWNIGEESFLQDQQVLSSLKFRVGYGQTSNQSVAPYTTLGGVSPNNGGVPIRYNYGTTKVVGYLPARIPDTSLDWEYTNTWNVGLDFGLLEDRITGSIEWYDAQTKNLLYNYQLPITSGYQDAFQTNLGRVENKGFEISISANIIKSPSGFTWSADLNWFLNRNKLLELAPGEERNIGNGLHVGYPLTAIYNFKKLGVWQLDEAAEAALYGQVPGQLKIADLSGPEGVPDGKLDEEYDRTVIGDQQADWQGGITNRFAYKGFDFSFVTYARFGGLLMSYLHAPNGAYLTNNNGLRNGLDVDYWTPDNPTNWFPAPNSALPGGAANSWSTLAYYDASFIRVRSINLGYTLPGSLADKISAKSLRVYFTAQNPFLLYAPYVTKWNGVDPEPTGQGQTGIVATGAGFRTGGQNQNLVISAATPPVRSFILGINVTF
jgi:TonB-dependent starch-binding outer membrane protein SusC